jgi:hypothetical protein
LLLMSSSHLQICCTSSTVDDDVEGSECTVQKYRLQKYNISLPRGIQTTWKWNETNFKGILVAMETSSGHICTRHVIIHVMCGKCWYTWIEAPRTLCGLHTCGVSSRAVIHVARVQLGCSALTRHSANPTHDVSFLIFSLSVHPSAKFQPTSFITHSVMWFSIKQLTIPTIYPSIHPPIQTSNPTQHNIYMSGFHSSTNPPICPSIHPSGYLSTLPYINTLSHLYIHPPIGYPHIHPPVSLLSIFPIIPSPVCTVYMQEMKRLLCGS